MNVTKMTASDIINVCMTVAVIQATCDLLAYWRVYSQEPYHRALEKRSRALFRKERAEKEAAQAKGKEEETSAKANKKPSSKASRTAKALERAEQDYVDANSFVARFAFLPSFLTSLVFVVLMRVMGTEHKGEIMGLLPFVPWNFVKRISARGLDFGTAVWEAEEKADVRNVTQAFSFVFLYMLAGLSVKFYTQRLFGMQTPGTS